MAEQSEDNFKVAPIISDQKLQEFKYKTISTLIGLSTLGHYQSNGKQLEPQTKAKIMAILLYFIQPCLIIIPNSIISSWTLHPLAVLIPTVLCPLTSILSDIILERKKKGHKYIMTIIYSYLWAVHFFISRQLFEYQYVSRGTYAAIMILSIITVLTSASTIGFSPLRQFSASTFDYLEFNSHSTLYVRFYANLLILITQLGLYYSPQATISHPALPTLQFVAALSFILWIFGWISSFYNNLSFIVNNLFNCLIFGQQLTHSGNNYRGHHVWWFPYLNLGLNVLAVGANVLLVLKMTANGQPLSKIVQSQHILLVCLAMLTSLLSTFIFYISYRLVSHKRQLIRFNKFNYTQIQGYDQNQNGKNRGKKVFKGKCFFGHKQILMIAATFFAPLVVCVLAAVALYKFYDAYGNGIVYQYNTNFFAEKLTTWILLLINVFSYLFFVILKQITRVRSKTGRKINACCSDQFHLQIQRDFLMKMVLKVTGPVAIMGLTLRIQDIQSMAWYILKLTPLRTESHPQIYFFIYYILIPVLIYRSYKRSQTFSHIFHISIIVSFVLTIINSSYYYYESIFVVLAMPNFPENPFRLLLISPFTIPQKLTHKSQNTYRIAYLLVNCITFILYVVTLGTFQFTMIFGLPMYWCVIPTINCQSTKQKNEDAHGAKESNNLKSTFDDFQATNQIIKISNQVGMSTPEHNLYEKIVSQIPFYIFRNKKPGYYLLRIGKYILLVEVINDFYGIFQTVSLIGLQTQQVTTCHAKQGQTIDRIVQYTWGDSINHQTCACDDALKTVLHEQHYVRANFTTQNQIQLTGVIESAQFYQLYKKCLIKSIIFNYNKLLLDNPNKQLTSRQIKQAEILLQDLQLRISKQKVDQIFPYSFITQKNGLIFNAKYKDSTSSKLVARKKLPPLTKKQDKNKKQKIIDDFADLIGASNTSDIIKTQALEQRPQQKIDIDKVDDQDIIKQAQVNDRKQNSQMHMAVIISAYLSVLGKINYINPQKLYRILKKESSALTQFQFQGGVELVANSLGCAMKIAISKQLQGQQTIQMEDFVLYDKNEFMGTTQSAGFSEAISQHKQDIWTVSYNQTKRMLAVKRLARSQTPLYMFSLQNLAVQAVWNNLRFQLLFATNDNDERYSIQTHQYLLRNLLVQGCEQPYGYAGYYSEQFLNL